MNKVVAIEIEFEIGVDHKGNADMFDPDPDPDSEKTFQVRSGLKLMTLSVKSGGLRRQGV
jgi:hypothetical protein